MPGNPRKRARRENAVAAQEELLERREKTLSEVTDPVPLEKVSASDRGKLMRITDKRKRLDKLFDIIGHDPALELIYLTKLDVHVAEYRHELKKLKKYMVDCEFFEEGQVEFLDKLMEFLKTVPLDPQLTAKINMDLLKYRAPQLKASQVEQTVDQTVTINVQKFSGE